MMLPLAGGEAWLRDGAASASAAEGYSAPIRVIGIISATARSLGAGSCRASSVWTTSTAWFRASRLSYKFQKFVGHLAIPPGLTSSRESSLADLGGRGWPSYRLAAASSRMGPNRSPTHP